jgi:hypothetical protein
MEPTCWEKTEGSIVLLGGFASMPALYDWLHGGIMAGWINRCCPDAAFADRVCYTSVAGRLVHGSETGLAQERRAYVSYSRICGDGNVWGDGLIPVQSALLRGAQEIVLHGVAHFFGRWYGAAAVIPLWWHDGLIKREEQVRQGV